MEAGGIDLTVSGGTPGYTFLWSDGATTQNIVDRTAASYTVTVTDSHNCTGGHELAQPSPNPAPLAIASDSITNVSCNGAANGSISVVVTGGTTPYTYNWSNGNISANNTGLSGNTYTLTVTDANSCNVTGTYTVAEPALLTSTVTGTNVTCHGAANAAAQR